MSVLLNRLGEFGTPGQDARPLTGDTDDLGDVDRRSSFRAVRNQQARETRLLEVDPFRDRRDPL
jgi:hypothetical protein